jgi:UDP-N-acetylmuramoyl-L-alanyl-D-glutamate--2,6-diaminopimelate ligase
MKAFLKKITPTFLIDFYHKRLAVFASFYHGSPSEEMIVIGVTGTNGKSTTVDLITEVLESNDARVGSTSTVKFKVADKVWLNDKKMTMLGRFQLQKLLKQMVKAGCKYAVIEVSSEGIKQFRHIGINFDYAVFTNLTPEHLESHGSFENYQKAKGQLFKHLMKKSRKKFGNREVKKISIVNNDDQYADFFKQIPTDKTLLFSAKDERINGLVAHDVSVTPDRTSFVVNDQQINLKLLGEFNVYNCLPAVLIGMEEGVHFADIKNSLESISVVEGRMELIDQGQDFLVLVDYAPEIASMEKLYETINLFKKSDWQVNKVIHVFGSCGGGRDKMRRPILGQIVGENADIAIVTNEDPYDDDPIEIIHQVKAGAEKAGKIKNENLFEILNRKKAIQKAIDLARKDDLVVVTGKGAEQAMAVAGGRYIKWDDRKVIREILNDKVSQNAV